MRIAGYHLECAIGHGALSTVYRTRGTVDTEPLAIKILREELCQEPTVVERFLDEARLANECSHPQLLPCLGSGADQGCYYLLYPWCREGDLQDRLRQRSDGCLSSDEVCRLLSDMISVLGHLHGAGIIHRDLKPGNILINGAGHFCLADLGLAIQHGRHQASGQPVGTLAYCSPEQLRGADDFGGAGDIYALGATIYRCLSGELPFPGDDRSRVVSAILDGAFPDLAKAAKQAPPWLVALVADCCRLNPDDRPHLIELKARVRKHAPQFQPNADLAYGVNCQQSDAVLCLDMEAHCFVPPTLLLTLNARKGGDEPWRQALLQEAGRLRPWPRRLVFAPPDDMPMRQSETEPVWTSEGSEGLDLYLELEAGQRLSGSELRQWLERLGPVTLPDPLRRTLLRHGISDCTRLALASGLLPALQKPWQWWRSGGQSTDLLPLQLLRKGDEIAVLVEQSAPRAQPGSNGYGDRLDPGPVCEEDPAIFFEGIQLIETSGEIRAQLPRCENDIIAARQAIADVTGVLLDYGDGHLAVVPAVKISTEELKHGPFESEFFILVDGDVPAGACLSSGIGVGVCGCVHQAEIEAAGFIRVTGSVSGAQTILRCGGGVIIEGQATGAEILARHCRIATALHCRLTLKTVARIGRLLGGYLWAASGMVIDRAGSAWAEPTRLRYGQPLESESSMAVENLAAGFQRRQKRRCLDWQRQMERELTALEQRTRRFQRSPKVSPGVDAGSQRRSSLQASLAAIGKGLPGPASANWMGGYIRVAVFPGVVVADAEGCWHPAGLRAPPELRRSSSTGAVLGSWRW
ncbi:MAG: DUF342 domain-containing protein [Planctomycetota bacterium]|nr:MAG: DUF342 domain-containing protein [Planctomycetota bacterium]